MSRRLASASARLILLALTIWGAAQQPAIEEIIVTAQNRSKRRSR